MPKSNSRSHKDRSDWGVIEMARERPIAAAATAAGAAAAGLFLWSKRAQISAQINNLSDQIGEWTDSMASSNTTSSRTGDTAGRSGMQTNMRSGAGSRAASGTRTASARGRGSNTGRPQGTRRTGSGSSHNGETSGQASGNS